MIFDILTPSCEFAKGTLRYHLRFLYGFIVYLSLFKNIALCTLRMYGLNWFWAYLKNIAFLAFEISQFFSIEPCISEPKHRYSWEKDLKEVDLSWESLRLMRSSNQPLADNSRSILIFWAGWLARERNNYNRSKSLSSKGISLSSLPFKF